jgi:hypothetical protein
MDATLPDVKPRVIAIDWSGAIQGAGRKIWLAEIQAGEVVRLEAGRDRSAVVEHLIREAERDPNLVVGLDFAFSFPSWFLETHGTPDAPAFWEVVQGQGERWLAECPTPFWGRPGVSCPDVPSLLRQTDRDVPAVGGIRPKSVFQIGGAGAVGTGSIRGIPILLQLRKAGFAAWPFDAPRFPLVVEIYPRALTGPVVKGSEVERRQYLMAHYPAIGTVMFDRGASSEDAFDALVSALIMARHARDFASLPSADGADHLEGRIWLPGLLPTRGPGGTPLTDVPMARRPHDSSKTRVGPVFRALLERRPTSSMWVRDLLDLAAGDACQHRPWRQHDLTVKEHHWAPVEKGLHPPVALLSWLVRNLPASPEDFPGSDDISANRRLLAEGDPVTIQRALTLLRQRGAQRGWQVLEGPTYPDAYLVTPDALIVVEGKRTEGAPTTRTTWMPDRHQMLRHLDAAWEIRGRRAVYGLFIVEAKEEAPGGVPTTWSDAVRLTRAMETLRESLPHRSTEEQEGIVRGFVGVTTWQAVCKRFGLDPVVTLR